MPYVPPRFISHVVFLRHSATKAEVQWSNGDVLHSIELFAVQGTRGPTGWWSASDSNKLLPTAHVTFTSEKLKAMMPEYPYHAMSNLMDHIEFVINSMYVPTVDADGTSVATEIRLRRLAF